MIDNRELRIGNYVNHKLNNDNYRIHKIVGLEENRIATIRFNQISEFPIYRDYFNSSFIQPIQLTGEILLKCGFEKSNDLDKFYHLDLLNEWTRIYFNPKHKVCTLSINQHDSRISIQYLHELQNLVFSLTQKELTIQL